VANSLIDETAKREYLQIHSDTTTLKERVFLKLDKYPNISPKELCNLLGLNYRKYGGSVRSYKYQYRKRESKNRQVLKSLNYHNVRYFGYALKSIDRDLGVTVGWKETKAKNRMLTWKNKLGRIEWFETGRINAWIKKPATLGKMKQLLADAYFRTGLVFDINIFGEWVENFRLKGFHLVLDTGEQLPYAKISNLKNDTGVVATIGDASHRTGLELQVVLPDWREKQDHLQELMIKQLTISNKQLDANNKQFLQFSDFMKQLVTPKTLRKESSRMVV